MMHTMLAAVMAAVAGALMLVPPRPAVAEPLASCRTLLAEVAARPGAGARDARPARPAAAATAPAPLDEATLERHRLCLLQVYRSTPKEWPAPQVDPGVSWQELGPRPALPAQLPALVTLGEQLFFDPRLSRNRDISCASCHAPHLGFGDGRRLALGHDGQAGPRNTPHLLGVAFVPQLMWDGRAASLESQALLPIVNPLEMAMDLPELQQRLQREADYPRRFAEAFGPGDVTLEKLGRALAAFERRIEAPRTRFDDFIEGQPSTLTEPELRGLHLFRTKARCMNCHSGAQFTQHEFHQIGLSALGRRLQDLGRQAITGKPEDTGAFRTPSLRGVARTAPYFHNGLTPSLRGVLENYNAGMPQPGKNAQGLMAIPPSPLIQPIGLTAKELQELEAFLRVL